MQGHILQNVTKRSLWTAPKDPNSNETNEAKNSVTPSPFLSVQI